MDGAFVASAWIFSDASTPQVLSSAPLTGWSLEPGELVVALLCAAVCGSDVHTVNGVRVDPAAPLVLGHEGIGRVVASSRDDARVGACVTWSLAAARCAPLHSCFACASAGIPQKCARVFKYGHAPWARGDAPSPRAAAEGLSGCYATHVLVRAGTAVESVDAAVREGVPLGALATANCAAATAVAAWRAAQRHLLASSRATAAAAAALRPRVVVFGAGLLGLYAAAAAKRDGAFVCVVDVVRARLDSARAFGADAVAETARGASADDVVAAAAAAAGGAADFDVAIEVCGLPDVVPSALRLLRAGGVLALVGMVHPASALGGTTGEAIIRKCATIVGVHNYEKDDLVEAVALVRGLHGTLPAGAWETLFSPAFPLDRLPDALALAATGQWTRVLIANEKHARPES
jgi:D-arabinose 1-dehydrogenase-like Zn-dependent alcohol dehydrogenase